MGENKMDKKYEQYFEDYVNFSGSIIVSVWLG